MNQRPALWHGIARVDHQIDDHLLQLPRVGQHAPQIVGKVGAECDMLADQALEQRRDARHHRVQVDHAGDQHLLAAEGEQLAGERGGTPGGIADLCDVVLEWVIAANFLEQHIGVAENDGEEIVEVVGDAARQPADRIQLLGLEILLFDSLALGHILGHTDRELRGTGSVADERNAQIAPDNLAIFADVALLHGIELAQCRPSTRQTTPRHYPRHPGG